MAVTSEIFFKNNFLGDTIKNIGRRRAKKVYNNIKHFLGEAESIIDIGAGNAFISELLVDDGFSVRSFDVTDLSLSNSVNTIVYNGENIPCEDDDSDIALLLSVLHHTPNPEILIKEAERTSSTIIIMEDIYKNSLHKYLTWFFDSLLNQQFKGHPHSNKTDEEWKNIFNEMGLQLISEKEKWWYVMRHKIYVLKK